MTRRESLERIRKEGVARALEKAERYRLLNEPFFSESICLDILAVEPDNDQARVCLILSLTDQLSSGAGDLESRARAEIDRLPGDYEKAYYNGIVCERRGYALLQSSGHGTRQAAYHFIDDAMVFYKKARGLAPAGNDDATLRWNTCVRLMERHRLEPPSEDDEELLASE